MGWQLRFHPYLTGDSSNNNRWAVHIADIILDNLPFSATVDRRMKKLVINYHNEAKMGEELAVFTKEFEEEQQLKYYVSGKLPSGKTCFESLAVFE